MHHTQDVKLFIAACVLVDDEIGPRAGLGAAVPGMSSRPATAASIASVYLAATRGPAF
jgi:hypothetical protein